MARKNPVERISSSTRSGSAAARSAGVGYSANSAGVTMFTRSSVRLRRQDRRDEQLVRVRVVERAAHVGIQLGESFRSRAAARCFAPRGRATAEQRRGRDRRTTLPEGARTARDAGPPPPAVTRNVAIRDRNEWRASRALSALHPVADLDVPVSTPERNCRAHPDAGPANAGIRRNDGARFSRPTQAAARTAALETLVPFHAPGGNSRAQQPARGASRRPTCAPGPTAVPRIRAPLLRGWACGAVAARGRSVREGATRSPEYPRHRARPGDRHCGTRRSGCDRRPRRAGPRHHRASRPSATPCGATSPSRRPIRSVSSPARPTRPLRTCTSRAATRSRRATGRWGSRAIRPTATTTRPLRCSPRPPTTSPAWAVASRSIWVFDPTPADDALLEASALRLAARPVPDAGPAAAHRGAEVRRRHRGAHVRTGPRRSRVARGQQPRLREPPRSGRLGPRRRSTRRMAEPWFDPGLFLLAVRRRRARRLLLAQGARADRSRAAHRRDLRDRRRSRAARAGLGRALAVGGLDRLAARGITTGMLFVAAENTGALALYRALGFTVHRTDRAYEHE